MRSFLFLYRRLKERSSLALVLLLVPFLSGFSCGPCPIPSTVEYLSGPTDRLSAGTYSIPNLQIEPAGLNAEPSMEQISELSIVIEDDEKSVVVHFQNANGEPISAEFTLGEMVLDGPLGEGPW